MAKRTAKKKLVPHTYKDAVPIDDLVPHPENPNSGDVGAIHTSIETVGFYGSILAQSGTNRILAGHHRLKAARESGLKELPVIFLDVDDKQARAILVSDNQHPRLAQWDDDLLAATLAQINEDGLLAATGFDGDDLDDLMRELDNTGIGGAGGVRDPEPGEPDAALKKWKVKLGDVWALDDQRIIVGDSTDPEVLRALLDGDTAAAVWTDPPYGVSYHNTVDASGKKRRDDVIQNDSMKPDDLGGFLKLAFDNAFSFADKGASVYVAAPPGPPLEQFVTVLNGAGVLRQCLAWVKDHMVFGRSDYHYQHEMILYGWTPGAAHSWQGDRKQTSVFNVARPHESKFHPTMKPVELIAECLRNSTARGDVVLDVFSGSGSTLVACHELGRRGRGVELDPRYAASTIERLSRIGVKPERIVKG